MQEQLTNFFNSPIGIALTSIVGFAIVAFVIFAKTSVGRKAIVKFAEGLAKALGYAKVASDAVNELKTEKDREIKELTDSLQAENEFEQVIAEATADVRIKAVGARSATIYYFD